MFSPLVSFGIEEAKNELAATVGSLLNPDEWFKAFKKNITIPTSGPAGQDKGKEITVPTPEEALREAAPKLQEINVGVREEVGIDLAKFIGWFAKVLKVLFQIVVSLLEQVSMAMGG